MSFGDGNLRERVADLNRQVDSYRRQLGGMTAAMNRLKDENRRLRAERTCENVGGHCSECGSVMYDAPNFCPNCGKAVKR